LHALARLDRTQHRVRVVRLHADHFDFGPHRFDVRRHARDQPAAADRDKDRVDRRLVLAQDFHRNRALAGDHVRVIERVHEGQAVLGFEFERVQVGIGVTFAGQHHLGAVRAHCVDLDLRRGHRHHDHRLAAQPLGRERHALRVVAGRGADHAPRELRGAELHHLVVRAAQFETEHRLRVFALQQHLVVQSLREVLRGLERCFDRDVVDAGGEDLLQVVGERQRGPHGRLLLRGGHSSVSSTICFAAPHHILGSAPGDSKEKSPGHYCLGLNPPMEEVEETSVGAGAESMPNPEFGSVSVTP